MFHLGRAALLAFAAALVLAGTAVAKVGGYIFATHSGVTCAFGTGDQGRGALCGLTSGRGYKVTVTDRRVIVTLHGHVVYSHKQPR